MKRLDRAVFEAIHSFWGKSRILDAVGVFFARTLTYLLVLGAVVFIFWMGMVAGRGTFVFTELLLAFLVARGVIATVLHSLIKRQRPFVALGFRPAFVPWTPGSMPSGHMAGLFAISFVIFSINPVWGGMYLILCLLVGLARIFVGVHWPSDVLAGILIGILCGFGVYWLFLPAGQSPLAVF